MTKLRRITLASTAAALILAGTPSARAREDSGLQPALERRVCALVSRSTQCFSFFQDTVRTQFHWPGHVEDRPVLVVTWFPSSPPVIAEMLLVDSTGQVSISRRSCDRAPYDGVVHRLEPGELQMLQTRLEVIDRSYRTSAFTRLMLVSFSDRGSWRTYAFDSERLPKSFFAALDTLRLPTRQVR